MIMTINTSSRFNIMSSSKRGQASLEMVVGLIILLVVAGVVIGFVMTTMNKGNMEQVTGGPAGKFMDNCKAFCETKDYMSYCTATMKGITGSTDWNRDNQESGLVKDKVSVWDFCEDRVYCFLVSECSTMTTEGCRNYMCQQYEKKYGDGEKAALKLREIYKMTDNPEKCSRTDSRTNQKTMLADLAPEENWLVSQFAGKGWCSAGSSSGIYTNCGDGYCDCLSGETYGTCPKSSGGDCLATSCQYTCGANGCENSLGENAQNCPADCGNNPNPPPQMYLRNCSYYETTSPSADLLGTVTCETNCLDDLVKKNASAVIIDSSMDKFARITESIDPQIGSALGTITFLPGKVALKPEHKDFPLGAITFYNLSELNQTTSGWVVILTCDNPKGSVSTGTSGVIKDPT
jgi:hypothetical protein